MAKIFLSGPGKIRRNMVSPTKPLDDEVWLYISENTKTGAVLSSDYCETRVNERAFRRLGPEHAAMMVKDAAQCGLADGWT